MSTDLYLPALPSLVRAFDTDVAAVQLTLSAFMFGFAAAQLVCGPLSDRFGRRPVLVASLALYVLATVGCLFAWSIEALIAARFLQALGACAGPVVGRAIVRDLYTPERAAQMFAYIAMAMAVAPALGPILGGAVVDTVGWPATFWVLILYGVILWVATVWTLAETNTRPDPRALERARLFGNYGRLVRDRRYCGYVLCVSFVFSGIFSFISGSSFVMIGHFGLSPPAYGLCFATFVVGYMTGSFTAGRLTPRLGIERMIVAGTWVAAGFGALGWALAFAGVDTVVAVVGPASLFMIGVGMVLPTAQAGAIGPYPRMAGVASALLGFVQMGLGATVGILVGHSYAGDQMPMMTAIFVVGALGLVSFQLLVRRGGRRGRPGREDEA